jgi:hypothetical protein
LKLKQHIVVVILCLIRFTHAVAQSDQIEVDDTLQLNALVKKTIEIPPFSLLNKDTIALGENDTLIYDSYTALGRPAVYDALHSFNSRKMDKFGGYLNEKINAGLAAVRKKGFNSDLKKLYIQINPQTLTVYWVAVVGPSQDGRCYVSVDSRGSACGGLPAVMKQCPNMHRIHAGLEPVKVLEFNEDVIQCFDWNGKPLDSVCRVVNIQQHFYKYYDAQIGTVISLNDYTKLEVEKERTTPIVAVAPVKKAPATPTHHKTYKVKSGDTLSEIAEKFHTTPTKIKKANGMRSDMIRIGQVLKIPR